MTSAFHLLSCKVAAVAYLLQLVD